MRQTPPNRAPDADEVLLLNAQTGKYVASIDPGALITDLAITGKSLAIATDEGLELIALQ
jgi:hypothetical protein